MYHAVKINNKIVLLPTVIIMLFSSIGILTIDYQLHHGLNDRVNTELRWLATVALESLSIANKPTTQEHIDVIADRIGQASGARITFIDQHGNITGDSRISVNRLSVQDNHQDRIEVAQALKTGTGYAKRHSKTLRQDLIYVAVLKRIDLNGQETPYLARASLASNTISGQIMEMRVALLSLLSAGVIVLVFSMAFTLRWLSQINEKDKAQLANTLHERNTEIESMHELDSLLSACIKLDDASGITQQLLPGLLKKTHGAISIYKPSRDRLITQMHWGDKQIDHSHFAPNHCWALRRGHMHLSKNESHRVKCVHFDNLKDTATLCIPLISHGQTVGVMHVIKAVFDKKTISLANAIAKRMGMAVANIELKSTLRQQAIKDTLTNLYNRRYLFESLEQLTARALRNDTQLGIIMLDLDHFKSLNDHYGHDTGDIALKNIADFFRKATRESDLVCRYGGEEFCIVCPDSTQEETLYVAKKFCVGIANLLIKINVTDTVKITLSGGIAMFPNPESSIELTIKEADQALYQAKHDGRNCIRAFSPKPPETIQ